jgi:hypothetical protein
LSRFANLKDDNRRLNEHTKYVMEQLTEMTDKWLREKVDARAIYAGLSTMHEYYYHLGLPKLGAGYMTRLEAEASKMAKALLEREVPAG